MTRIRRNAGVALGCMVLLMSACSTVQSSPCNSVVTTDPMPEWADAGFSDDARVPHVFSQDRRIVAVPFAGTLVASTSSEPRNKVLLVAREPVQAPTTLTIDAQLDGSGEVVHRERAAGPGPGSLDMPQAGCWVMQVRWGGESDVLNLEYVDQ